MKGVKLKIIIGALFLIATCCAKENEDLPIDKKILGEWIWLESKGGLAGSISYTPENTGDVRKMIFSSDSIIHIVLNGDTITTTSYYISRENSVLLHVEFDFITINYSYQLPDTIIVLPMRYMIRTIADVLEIDEDVYDGFGHRYKRLR